MRSTCASALCAALVPFLPFCSKPAGTLQVLAVVERVSPRIRAQLVMFTYYNPIMRRGAERFCQQAKAAGASGATLPRI